MGDKIVIMGQGYVGLPLAMAAAAAGHEVVGFEPDRHRLTLLSARQSYVEDVPSSVLAAHTDSRAYMATSYPQALRGFDVAVITVPTPLKDGGPDLGHVREAAAAVAWHVREGSLIALESSAHPGTTRDIVIPLLEEYSDLTAGEDFHVAFIPGWIPGDTRRIVSGLTMACRQRAAHFYQQITKPVALAESLEEAERHSLARAPESLQG